MALFAKLLCGLNFGAGPGSNIQPTSTNYNCFFPKPGFGMLTVYHKPRESSWATQEFPILRDSEIPYIMFGPRHTCPIRVIQSLDFYV